MAGDMGTLSPPLVGFLHAVQLRHRGGAAASITMVGAVHAFESGQAWTFMPSDNAS